MKRIKLSISGDSGNIPVSGSPFWRYSLNLSWEEVIGVLGLDDSLISRLKNWKDSVLQADNLYSWEGKREELVKCEIEGLAILLELRKKLPDYQITYSSNFNSYNCVLNEEQVDDSY